MKTNKIMIRKMGQFDVKQRTKDGMFNATELLKQWNKASGLKKEVKDFLSLGQTKSFIDVLENEEVPNGGDYPYLATRGKQGGTWMHPYLFIDFAMWLNPKFKYFVIKFVYDQLIQLRHSAGDHYRGLTSALATLDDVDYAKVAMGLNYIVFGRHDKELRQSATPEQLDRLTEVQKQLAFAINMGYIKSFDQLMSEMRKLWQIQLKQK